MSPSKFQDSEVTKGVMARGLPLPLRINKDSHAIHKAESSAKPQPPPVIIYTHSPKVIHTHAKAFMALVQNLTGLKRDDVKAEAEADADAAIKEEAASNFSDDKPIGIGYDDTPSLLTDDPRFLNDVKQQQQDYKMSSSFLIDAPLFTPNSTEFFCSSRPSSMFQPPNMAGAVSTSISPSFMDYVKAYSEY